MKNQSIDHCIKGNKTLRSQLNQRCTRLEHWKRQNLTQGNERRPRTNGKMGQARGLGDLIISKVTTLPKAIYRFNTVTTNITMVFFKEIKKPIFSSLLTFTPAVLCAWCALAPHICRTPHFISFQWGCHPLSHLSPVISSLCPSLITLVFLVPLYGPYF